MFKAIKMKRKVKLIIAAFDRHIFHGDEEISSYGQYASDRPIPKQKIVLELFRLDLFQLWATLTSGSVQQSAFGPYATHIYNEVAKRWAKKWGINMNSDPHALIADYIHACQCATWDTKNPTERPFYAAATVFADSLGIWRDEADGMHRLVEANSIGRQIILSNDLICKIAETN
jgi:hypothetical protein